MDDEISSPLDNVTVLTDLGSVNRGHGIDHGDRPGWTRPYSNYPTSNDT